MQVTSADARARPAFRPRRLALFIDGTWNVEDNNTNVWRLYSLSAFADLDGEDQLCFYTKGVGTSYGSKLKGGVLGMGFSQILRQAYDWLIAHYRKDDEIFVFGFSRGSYAARSLAGLVARCGVPTAGSPIGVDEIYDRYKGGDDERTIYKLLEDHAAGKASDFSPFERWMVDYCVTAKVKMVGVWDTVGSLVGRYDYLETGLRQPIENVFHALALDEHRFSFKPTLLTFNVHADRPAAERTKPRPIEAVEQRWFVGAHANVGGGYFSDPLSQRPLAWIAGKAEALGLRLAAPIGQDEHPWTYPVADSFRRFAYGLYQVPFLGIPYLRKVGEPDRVQGAVTTSNVNEAIDVSVFERWRRDERYRPRNLEAWASRLGVDPGSLTCSVLASDPKVAPPA